MRILYIYQYYNTPDCAATARHFTFIEHLAKEHEITLLTTTANLKARITERFPWLPPNVKATHFDIRYRNEMPAVSRLRAFTSFAVRAIAKGIVSSKPDVVLGISTPLSAAWAASVVARRHGVPWVFEVKDLWPDFPVQMGGVRSKRARRGLYRLEQNLYKSASHIVTLSPDMTEHVGRFVRSDKVTTILNGTDFHMVDAPFDESALRYRHDLQGKKIVFYGGTLGRANDIPLLIDTAKSLAHRPDIAIVLAGRGYHAERAREAMASLSNFVALPPLPKHEVLHWFKLASLTVVPFLGLPVLSANSPAKFFDSLAAGTPVIVTNPGWTRTYVEHNNVGAYVPPSDPGALSATIIRLLADEKELSSMGARARLLAESQFDRRDLAARFERILLEASGGTSHVTSAPVPALELA